MNADALGAIPAASGPAADHSPTAVVLLDSGKSGSTRANEEGNIAAPAKACNNRDRLSNHTEGDVAENTADKANNSKPI